MFCSKCGQQIPDESVFCSFCGNKIEIVSVADSEPMKESVPQSEQTPAPQPAVAPQPTPAPQPAVAPQPTVAPKSVPVQNYGVQKKKTNPLVWIGIGVGVLALFIICLVLLFSKKTTIDLSKYVNVEYEGYDTLGRATVVIDKDGLREKYSKKIKLNKSAAKKDLVEGGGGLISPKAANELINAMTEKDIMNSLISDINGSLDKSTELSNGDVLTYTFDCDEEDAEKFFNCKFKTEDLTFVVEGLENVGTFNPFDGIEVSFSGIAPEGEVQINRTNNANEYSSIRFSADKEENVSNGDVITVTASVSWDTDSYIREYGKLPSPTEKTYTVEGLMSYITSGSEIPESCMELMKKQSNDIIAAQAAKNLSDEEELIQVSYVGYYFLNKKPNIYGAQNRCALVYQISIQQTVEDRDDKKQKTMLTYYYPIEYSELMLDENGEGVVDISRYDEHRNYFEFDTGIKYSRWSDSGKTFHYYGYENLDLLKNEIITKNMAEYNGEEFIDASLCEIPESNSTESEDDENLVSNADYMLPDSDSKYYDEDDLEGFSADDCMFARNELYARYGRIFKDDKIRQYFESKDWYEGTVDPSDFDENCLNEYEKANRDLIVSYEKKMGYK